LYSKSQYMLHILYQMKRPQGKKARKSKQAARFIIMSHHPTAFILGTANRRPPLRQSMNIPPRLGMRDLRDRRAKVS